MSLFSAHTDTFSPDHLDRFVALVVTDEELGVTGRFLTLDLGVVSGRERVRIVLVDGRAVAAAPDDDLVGCAVVLSGSPADWQRFCTELPGPGYNDVIGMERDLETFSIPVGRHLFIRHLRSLSRVLRLLQVAGGHEVASAARG